MVPRVQELAADWQYDHISIGYPGPVLHDKPITEPHNLAPGWVGFDFAAAFNRPVRIINDAAMQALGSYEGGGCCSSGWEPAWDRRWSSTGCWNRWSCATCRYRKRTFEDYVGLRGLEKFGKDRWRALVADVVQAVHGTRARLRRARRRQREEIESPAAEMPRGRERQRLSRRVSPVGANRYAGGGECLDRPDNNRSPDGNDFDE